MTALSDIEDMISLLDQISCFSVDLFDEGTGSINPSYLPISELLKVARTCTMSGYDDEALLGDFLEIWFEYDSLSFEHPHDKAVVDNLMIHIDRCRMIRDYLHEHADRTVDSGAVASRKCGKNIEFHDYLLSLSSTAFFSLFFHSPTLRLSISLALIGFI
jgi:hypothetical protein